MPDHPVVTVGARITPDWTGDRECHTLSVPLPPDGVFLLEVGAWPPDARGRCSFVMYWRAYRVDLDHEGLRAQHFHGNLRGHIRDALRRGWTVQPIGRFETETARVIAEEVAALDAIGAPQPT